MEEIFQRPNFMLYLPLGKYKSSFGLEKAVCNHGFFMMAPNKWIPSVKALQRPLRLVDNCASVIVTITHPAEDSNLHIYVHDLEALSLENQQAILGQVARMLRLNDKDEKAVNEFQELHPQAKKKGFGRIFRSPSLFEDAVKSILLTNCTWGRTLDMAKSLCELQLQLRIASHSNGRKQVQPKENVGKTSAKVNDKYGNNENLLNLTSCKDRSMGNFPNSMELANLSESYLNEHCNLGFRARYIIKLAQMIERRTFDLGKLEHELDSCSYEVVHRKLSRLKGFGPFTIASILMCLGCYQKVPADSETTRHLKQDFGSSVFCLGTWNVKFQVSKD